jgi:hypothetical protein
MSDRPVIFSGPMVRALLEGRKTMTRRLAWKSIEPVEVLASEQLEDHELRGWDCREQADGTWLVHKPSPWQKVKPGDRLWVRENWRFINMMEQQGQCAACTGYEADGPDLPNRPMIPITVEAYHGLWDRKRDIWTHRRQPSIHMPRWASRLTLVVTATKMERLQDISEEDAIAEGIFQVRHGWHWEPDARVTFPTPRDAFIGLWDHVHGEDAWAETCQNEVVALTFTVHRCNIDAMKEAA